MAGGEVGWGVGGECGGGGVRGGGEGGVWVVGCVLTSH